MLPPEATRDPMHATHPIQPGAAPIDAGQGDDLERARRFCDAARRDMDAVVHAAREEASDPGRDPHWLCERLTRIQRGAKRARARAVYRSAQDAMGLIHCDGPHLPIDWTQVDGRLIVLNKLLTQYEAGLAELESAARPRLPDVAANDTARWAAARDTLAALTARLQPVDAPALARLMALDAQDCEAAAPAPTGEPLDDAMPELVQRLLGCGRTFGKTLSVSYAVDAVHLPADARADLVAALWDDLSPLVAANMPLQGVGHIDIAVDGAELLATGSGFAPVRVPLPAPAKPAPAKPARRHAFRPVPRIMDGTEAELRAQLSRLLDGAP